MNEYTRFKLGERLCSFIGLYRYSNKRQEEFDKLADNFELNLNLGVQFSPYLVVFLGYFNAKSNFEGNVIETLFSQFRFIK